MNKKTNIWMPYTQMQTAADPLNIIRTEGSWMINNEGVYLLDGIASWWTACHGYQHPYIMRAIHEQMQSLSHVMMGGIVHPQALRLAERLKNLMPGNIDYVMFSESGSVAVEIALKIALQSWQLQGSSQRQHFISLQNAYHGDTFLTMALCDPEKGMHRSFEHHLPSHHCIALPNTAEEWDALEAWLASHAHTIAAIIIEPLVQGAAGMQMYSPEQLKKLCEKCRQYSILIIMDEIFTGFYRTGTLLACEQPDIIPDIICLSKALTGGTLPLAVTMISTPLYEAFLNEDPYKAFMHGSTFMGNALACAAANASLDLFEKENYSEKVKLVEQHLQETLMPLKSLPHVQDVRIKGAIGAIELVSCNRGDMQRFQQHCLADNVWLRPIGNVIYTTPALNMDHDLLSKITTAITKHIEKSSLIRSHTSLGAIP